MRAKTRAQRAAAAAFCLLLSAFAAAPAQPPAPAAEFDAQWGSPDHMLFLPAIYAELAGRN